MPNSYETVSLIFVGALWGCTNPLLRQGAMSSEEEPKSTPESSDVSSAKQGLLSTLLTFLKKLRHIRVWMPYVVNQSGSLLYYVTLAQSNLSIAVPICNALALVFSILTSVLLGERIHKPVQTVVGAALVVAGVTLCLNTAED